MTTLRLLLAARADRLAPLAAALDAERRRAREQLDAAGRAAVLQRVEDDAFAAQYPGRRAFDAVLAVDASDEDAARAAGRLVDLCRGADERLGALVHADLCGAVVGERRRVLGREGPVRMLYTMRRKADVTARAFREHWAGPHADFGRRMGGATGYDQLHADADASRAATRVAGFGVWCIDGIAEVHMDSLDDFVRAAAADPALGAEAVADELRFVDRPNSVGFVCTVAPVPDATLD